MKLYYPNKLSFKYIVDINNYKHLMYYSVLIKCNYVMIFSQVTFFSALYNKIWITIYIILYY